MVVFQNSYQSKKLLTLDKLVTMATTKGLSLICEIPQFANAYLGKVTKFQGYGLFRFGVLSNLLARRWKTPPGMNRVNLLGEISKHFRFMETHVVRNHVNFQINLVSPNI